MIIGVPKETFPGERRVALIPAVVSALAKAGHEVLLELGAGKESGYSDAAYQEKGAKIALSRREVFSSSAAILQVRSLGSNAKEGRADLELLKSGQTVVGQHDPLGAPQAVKELASRGVMAFSMELMPRITRAQSMDVLSSMATIAGYKAVLLAAETLPRMFPMLMTAAGTISPARVFIVGVGVAGLQAIATARKLGAVVQAYDVRPAVKEQVHSVGAKFVEMELETAGSEGKGGYAKELGEDFYKKQRELMTRVVAESDVVITTAAIPGKKSPVLVTKEMVEKMPEGGVIIDLAAERGGNCELTQADEIVRVHGVTILGPTNLSSTIPYHASQMYSKNISTFFAYLAKKGDLQISPEDEIVRETLLTRDGEVVHPKIRELLSLPPLQPESKPEEKKEEPVKTAS